METVYKPMSGEFVNAAISKLTTVTEEAVEVNLAVASNYKALVNGGNGRLLNIVGSDYRVVQHVDAFRPVIDGLTVAGVKEFEFSLFERPGDAMLNVFTSFASDGSSGVKLGFRVKNHIDGRGALKYGLGMRTYRQVIEQVTENEITAWGYRLACQNGMMIRVPLEWRKVVKDVVRTKLQEIISVSRRIIHRGDVDSKIAEIKYIIEAMSYLQEPVAAIIEEAKLLTYDDVQKVKNLIAFHVGKRNSSQIFSQYEREEQTLWGLYNAITNVASHQEKMKMNRRDVLLASAANLLNAELDPIMVVQ